MLGDYIEFVRQNRRFAAFGFLIALGSSFGQTFFIGIFGPSIQQEFGLSHTAWGSVYLAGTLASALVLPFSGRLIDRLPLVPFTLSVCLLLALACGSIAAAPSVLFLVFSIFLLRQGGQGLMSHVALTTMARYFTATRGRAIALATMGMALGEAILPFSAVGLIAIWGWRPTYAGAGLALILIWVPLAWWLLSPMRATGTAQAAAPGEPARARTPVRSWTRREVIRDLRFYLILPAIVAPSLIVTAMFFHHLNLADAKGWSHTWVTGNYVMYAMGSVATSLIAGRLIDRYSAKAMVPVLLLPLVVAMALMAMAENAWVVIVYFILLGINTGISQTSVPALWAELYGVDHIGGIRSLAASMSVFASALGPVIAGALMDSGLAIETVCWIFGAGALLGSLAVRAGLRKRGAP